MAHLKDIRDFVEGYLESFKHYTLDYDKDLLIAPMYPLKDRNFDSEKDTIMSKGYIGDTFKDKGFNVEVYVADYEYMTKPRWVNWWEGSTRPHKAYLRKWVTLKVTGKNFEEGA
jgi:hypothetical protein